MSNSQADPSFPSGFHNPANDNQGRSMSQYYVSGQSSSGLYGCHGSPVPIGYSYSTAPTSGQPAPASRDSNPSPYSDFRSTEWRCEACNLSLDSETALENHKSSHITCTECDFMAAPKIVKAHHQARHGKFAGSGYKTVTVAVPGCPVQRFRICVGSRPEDIQQWIADRKRRFPRKNPAVAATKGNSIADKKEPSSGLSGLLDGYGSSSSEEDTEPAIANEASQTDLPINKGESTNAQVQQTAGQADQTCSETTRPDSSSFRTRPCKFFLRNGSCRNGDKCTFAHERPTPSSNAANQRAPKRRKANPTLLEKLLQKDIQRETALTLQLLDYIVESDFLEKK